MLLSYTTKELDQLARLMRAEAIGEGDNGMLMVGNVGVNRVISDCLDFLNIRTVTDMLNQSPGGFSGVKSPLYFTGESTTKEKQLAERVLKGEYYYPATNALWFYAPKIGEACIGYWYNQKNSGRYKNHCFYEPALGICKRIH
jgi:N-acetylmuramoyl-L-alanine amidase